MATELLSIGTNVTPSTDFTIPSDEQKTVIIKGNSSDGRFPNSQIYLQIKDDDNKYWTVDTLTTHNPALIIVSPGTYRLVRKEGGAAAGVFSA